MSREGGGAGAEGWESESRDERLIAGEKAYKESKWEEDEEKGALLHPGEDPHTTGRVSSFLTTLFASFLLLGMLGLKVESCSVFKASVGIFVEWAWLLLTWPSGM